MKDKDTIRELLIDAIHYDLEARNYFEKNLNNRELLDLLVEFALDDYSSDASMGAAYWISKFSKELLYEIEDKLLKLQEYELDNIVLPILVALGRIKSKNGLKFLIEKRIEPRMGWEAKALKYYLDYIK
ncbi:hypothetical protein [Clostridium sp. YIM B02555]|uniref:hypothetical protein n=1 Tax=Clostridium sp. YIM B02555 TaxID=2911968 RepID=UPI001EEE0E69|nr:hypothetical protein [Clostridium sp. YIM B02555]